MAAGCGGRGSVVLDEVQMEGKRRMSAAEFMRGYQIRSGERLGLERSAARWRAFCVEAWCAGEACGGRADGFRGRGDCEVSPSRAAAFEILTWWPRVRA